MSLKNTNPTPAPAVQPGNSVESLCKMGEYMQTSGQALQEAKMLAEELATEQTKVASIVPEIVKQLEAAGLVPVVERDGVIESLNTHSGALKIASRLCALYTKRVVKQASESPRVGEGSDMGRQRSDVSTPMIPIGHAIGPNDLRPSDLPLLELAGMFSGN